MDVLIVHVMLWGGVSKQVLVCASKAFELCCILNIETQLLCVLLYCPSEENEFGLKAMHGKCHGVWKRTLGLGPVEYLKLFTECAELEGSHKDQ